MNTRRIAAGIGTLLLVSGVAWTALASGSSGSSPAGHDTSWPVAAAPGAAKAAVRAAEAAGHEVIRVREFQERARYIDAGREGDSPGDLILFESRLRSGGEKVGRDSVRCLFGIRSFSCDGSFLIAGRGKIVVSGALFAAREDSRLAITGGTGAFKDARGQMTVEEGGGSSTRLVFELLPR